MRGSSAFETSGRDEYEMIRECGRYGRGCGEFEKAL